MKTLLKNAHIITVDDNDTQFACGALLVEDDRITWVGNAADAHEVDAEVIDCGGDILIPGLINLHTHLAMTLFRGYGNDLPLNDWLTKKIFPIEDHLTEESVYWGGMAGISEMLLSGTTCFRDMYFLVDATVKAVEQTGIRAVVSRCVSDNPNFWGGIKEFEEAFEKYDGAFDGRLNIKLDPHAEYTHSDATLTATKNAAPSHLMIHASETKSEVEGCRERHGGKSPIAHLSQLGVFDQPAIAAHCVWVDEDDMDIMLEHNVSVAHCPSSNMKLASGMCPVADMLSKGINVGIGTDGASSNNNLDMLEEMHLAALMGKVRSLSATDLPAQQVLRMATINGAKALGMQDIIGSLEAGKKADIVRLGTHSPEARPLRHALQHVVYSLGRNDVHSVMVDGKMLVRDGKLEGLNMQEILANFERCAEQLYSQVGE